MKFNIILSLFLLADTSLAAINCSNPKEVCVDPGGDTRYFDGAPYSLPCWKYEITYECRADAANDCDALRMQGCYQATAACKTTWNGACAVQEEVFKCSTKECKETEENVCAENINCIDGGCIPTVSDKNQNFGKASSNLAVLNEAGREFRENNKGEIEVKKPYIFSGQSMECSKNIAGFKNCCGVTGHGWGLGFLASCDEEEKVLAEKRGKGLAIFMGDYCHNRELGICTSEHYVYCVYPTKIGRIIQEKGGVEQLHKSLGNAGDGSAPRCIGLTPEELSKINFDKIDFSELVDDLKGNLNNKGDPQVKFNEAKGRVNYDDAKTRSVDKNLSIPQQASGRIKDFYERSKK